jgi:endonuclease/exonuclease/phosphatase family metal-dependent hydrolase
MIKREAMIRQVLGAAAKAGAKKVIIAGDFNSDRFQKQFKDEKIFALLDTADFSDGWNGSQANERGTHPGNTRWPDSTLDYVFHKGFDKTAMRTLAPAHPVSDHRLAVFELQ